MTVDTLKSIVSPEYVCYKTEIKKNRIERE